MHDTTCIGPNAITRVAEALRADVGAACTAGLFGRADLAAYLERPPEHMVEEAEVARLHRLLRETLGPARAKCVARSAGALTGDYLLARRIPQAVQLFLRNLPARLASRILLSAIRRNSWTFSGSGEFRAQPGHPALLSISGNPLCRDASSELPVCDYYAATFERLYRDLVDQNAIVTETECEAAGAPACRFEVRWQTTTL